MSEKKEVVVKEEKLGIKEVSEAFIALGKLAGFAGNILQDGKLGADDLVHLVELGSQFEALAEGVKDISKAKKELEDLDQAEVIALAALAYDVFAQFKAAKKAK